MVVGCENVSVDHDESLLFGEVRRASPKNISEKKGIVVIAPRSHSNSQNSTKCAIKQHFFFHPIFWTRMKDFRREGGTSRSIIQQVIEDKF